MLCFATQTVRFGKLELLRYREEDSDVPFSALCGRQDTWAPATISLRCDC
jgi:hypothetical protein